MTSQLTNITPMRQTAINLYQAHDAEGVANVARAMDGVIVLARKIRTTDIDQLNAAIVQWYQTQREAGLLLEEIAPHGGDRTQPARSTLAKEKISAKESARWRAYARIDPQDAVAFFRDWAHEHPGEPISLTALLNQQTETESDGRDPGDLASEMLGRVWGLLTGIRGIYQVPEYYYRLAGDLLDTMKERKE